MSKIIDLYIFVLNIIPKIFESTFKDKITPILDSVISRRQQYGFVSGRSVTSNLALYAQYLLTEIENGCQVDAVYTDFSKAFDKVSIQKLVCKLANVGLYRCPQKKTSP
jgi:hypothetical protein